MTDFIAGYLPLFNLVILNCGLALSQYVVLRAGVFSVATAGLGSIGAYTAGILILSYGVPTLVAVILGALVGMIAALILSLPLARLRGVFQAIATVAMVQIILSITLYADDITGGANGLNGLPRLVGTPALVLFIAVCIYVLYSLGRGRVGSAFDAIRQDETVAVPLGIAVRRHRRRHRRADGMPQPQRGSGGIRLRHADHRACLCRARRPPIRGRPTRRRGDPIAAARDRPPPRR
jgi:branched-chain amino acid transport system permease protein